MEIAHQSLMFHRRPRGILIVIYTNATETLFQKSIGNNTFFAIVVFFFDIPPIVRIYDMHKYKVHRKADLLEMSLLLADS